MTKNLDEIRLKNIFRKIFEKSIDFSENSDIIIIIKGRKQPQMIACHCECSTGVGAFEKKSEKM